MEPFEHTAEPAPRWSGLKLRVISGAVMAALLLLALGIGGWFFTLMVIAAAVQMIREWDSITLQESKLWKAAGVAYVALPCSCLIWLRNLEMGTHPHSGAAIVLFIMVTVWATDIGAYFAGRRIGGPKLMPSVSPNKTWAGLGGGVVAAALAGGFATFFSPYPPSFIAGMDMGILLAIIAQSGDLFESWLKRRAGVKDSSNLIPGHGGLLDRVDGLIFTVPVFAFFAYLSGVLV